MKVRLAEESGFCFGVKKALDRIKTIEGGEDVYVLGKLIHNPQVIEELKKKGIKFIEDIGDIGEGTLVISAHGVSDEVIWEAKGKWLRIIDTTCPLVKNVHNITKNLEKQGYRIIIYGDKEHTEVKGIKGNLKEPIIISDVSRITSYRRVACRAKPNEPSCAGRVVLEHAQKLSTNGEEVGFQPPVPNCWKVSDISELDSLEEGRYALVSQTTQDVAKFNEVSERLKEKVGDLIVSDTICSATRLRQENAGKIAKEVELMIVIGGYNSANTKRLRDICSEIVETKHIESADELKKEWFRGKENIGVTAGASTPESVIKEVVDSINKF